MDLNNFAASSKFSFAKASEHLKGAVLSVAVALTLSAPSVAADSKIDRGAFLDNENASYTESLNVNREQHDHTGGWQHFVDRSQPDVNGSEYLQGLEDSGTLITPTSYSDYFELANGGSGEGNVEVFRNPLGRDGIVLMGTSDYYQKRGFLDQVFGEDSIPHRDGRDKPTQAIADASNEWQESPLERSEVKQLKRDAVEKVSSVISGLENDNIRHKMGTMAFKGVAGGFSERSFELVKNIEGFSNGIARNPGSHFYFDDGNSKVNFTSMYSGGSGIVRMVDQMEAFNASAAEGSTQLYENQSFLTKDHLEIDRELIDELSDEQKLAISNTATMIHEVFHGMSTSSTNPSQPSLLFGAYNQTFNLYGSSADKPLGMSKTLSTDMGAFRHTVESNSDMASIAIVASGASDSEWEYAKLLQQTLRKNSLLAREVFQKSESGTYTMDLSNVSERVLSGDADDSGVWQNHDVAFLTVGWSRAYDDARNGDDPNNLMDLPSNPVKLSIASYIASTVVMKELSVMTNDWQYLDTSDYTEFNERGAEIMHDFVKSPEFSQMIQKLDTSSLEPVCDAACDAELTKGVELGFAGELERAVHVTDLEQVALEMELANQMGIGDQIKHAEVITDLSGIMNEMQLGDEMQLAEGVQLDAEQPELGAEGYTIVSDTFDGLEAVEKALESEPLSEMESPAVTSEKRRGFSPTV